MHIAILVTDTSLADPILERMEKSVNLSWEVADSPRAFLDARKNDARPQETVVLALGDPRKALGGTEFCERYATVVVLASFDASEAAELLGAGVQEVIPAKGCTSAQLSQYLRHALIRHQRQRTMLRVISREEMSASLDRLPMAVVIISSDRRLIAANDKGRKFLSREDLIRVDQAGVISVRNKTLSDGIDDLLSAMKIAGVEPGFMAETVKGNSSDLYFLGLPAGRNAKRQALTLFVFSEADEISVSAPVLQRLYGLTEAEAGLAAGLAKGKSLEDMADGTGRSIQTLRSQLKQIFLKMDVKRQPELIKAILSGPAAIQTDRKEGDGTSQPAAAKSVSASSYADV